MYTWITPFLNTRYMPITIDDPHCAFVLLLLKESTEEWNGDCSVNHLDLSSISYDHFNIYDFSFWNLLKWN